MKIFMSHSGRQKLFVKELTRRLPESISLWIDERELRLGAHIEPALQTAVQRDCDLFIAVIDDHAVKSPWVKSEINWALERESALGRVFLLPIVLDQSAWEQLDGQAFQGKKYLACPDFTDSTLDAVARTLTSEITSWLILRFDGTGETHPSSGLSALDQADKYVSALAEEIKAIVLPHRERNPLPLARLLAALRGRPMFEQVTQHELTDLLARMQNRHLLNGVAFDGHEIFLSQERYSFKSGIHLSLKKRIARAAISKIRSHTTLAVDGGSTTLEMMRLLGSRVRARSIANLRLLTNSLPVANEILTTLSDMGVGDLDGLIDVFVLGGQCRPVSMTIVPSDILKRGAEMVTSVPAWEALIRELGGLDCAFLGANGIYRAEGFANHSRFEIWAKRAILAAAHERYVLVDPSKFRVQQEEPFALFSEGLRVITARTDEYADAVTTFKTLIEGTPTSIEEV